MKTREEREELREGKAERGRGRGAEGKRRMRGGGEGSHEDSGSPQEWVVNAPAVPTLR